MSLTEECVFASELHPTARAIYLENWPSAQLEGDIRLVPAEEVPDHELLVGGFPCQCPGDAKGILLRENGRSR